MCHLENPSASAMIFHQTKLSRVSRLNLTLMWCRREFEDHGLNAKFAQCNISFNDQKGTLRRVLPGEKRNMVYIPDLVAS